MRTREGASTEVLTAQQDAAYWENWFYWDGAIPWAHTQPFFLPPAPTMRLQLHMSVNWKIAIRNLLRRSWWRKQCRYTEVLGSRLPVYVRACRFSITQLWQRTHLGGHTGADRMGRQQNLASQAVPLRWPRIVPLLLLCWVEDGYNSRWGFLVLCAGKAVQGKAIFSLGGQGVGGEVLSFLMWQFSSKAHAPFSPHSMAVKYESPWCPR